MDKELLKKKLFLLKESAKLLELRQNKYEELQTLTKSEEVAKIERELREIDHTLDYLMDEELRSKEELLDEITNEILAEIPESKISYQRLAEESRILAKSKEELLLLLPYSQKYATRFSKAAALLQKRSFLSFFLGRHPKVLLSYEIATLSKEAAADQEKVAALVFTTKSTKKLQRELQTLLHNLVEEANKRWNKALYEEAFSYFLETATDLHTEIERLLNKNREQTDLLSSKIETWIQEWIMLS